ncbi:MAG TPA: RNA-binding S4 domain-containing protein [Thermoanaerobaculia bacterium]|nr:RNA-binding S4 domain-containing protein [Thermoanaerobaculia bacterium]
MKINGQRVKPAAGVKPGDAIEFLHGTHYRRVVVGEVPVIQVSKDVARTMYVDETPKQDSGVTRLALRERGSGRPTKRDRRKLDKFRR